MSKIVVVTGGAGFLGSHLCQGLLNPAGKILGEIEKVICLDNLSSGREKNIKNLFGTGKFDFIQHDIINPLGSSSLKIKVDFIFNLACIASPPRYQKDPIQTLKSSFFGIINMLELAKKNNAVLIQASTSEVYGDPDPRMHRQQVEEYWGNVNPIGKRACYDEGKRCAETLCFDYNRKLNVPIKVCRIFNTYGPHMDPEDGRIISNFITQALEGKDITIYGDGTQSRSFCYVDDLVEGIIRMAALPNDELGPINLGNPAANLSVKEVAELIIRLTSSNSVIKTLPLPEDDPKIRKPDISLAKRKLNWAPKTDLETGLQKTIEYFEKELNH